MELFYIKKKANLFHSKISVLGEYIFDKNLGVDDTVVRKVGGARVYPARLVRLSFAIFVVYFFQCIQLQRADIEFYQLINESTTNTEELL